MKIVSFNVNGIRARLHQLEALSERHRPEIVGLQETKVRDEDFPFSDVAALGYNAHVYGQKTHYGVALLTRLTAESVFKGLPGEGENAQKRLISATFRLADNRRLHVINGYFPQGENRRHEVKFPAKERFFHDVAQYLKLSFDPEDYLVLLGDFNVAPLDKDIGIGSDNARRWLQTGKCSFLPEERLWFSRFNQWGLEDTFRALHPEEENRFSWFDYRSRGFESEPKRGLRIDGVLATQPLLDRCRGGDICYDIRAMQKPSDHCPVWARFDLKT